MFLIKTRGDNALNTGLLTLKDISIPSKPIFLTLSKRYNALSVKLGTQIRAKAPYFISMYSPSRLRII